MKNREYIIAALRGRGMIDEKTEEVCYSCKNFLYESIYGDGICDITNEPVEGTDYCGRWEVQNDK